MFILLGDGWRQKQLELEQKHYELPPGKIGMRKRYGTLEESFVQFEIGILGLVLVVEDGSSYV